MSLDGHVYWSAHPPGVSYPSDTNEVSPGRYLIADYSDPGQVVIFTRTGQLVWRFRPAGAALNHPSLALPLPNGNILVNDDHNDRVIVISPKTNRIIWQYGHDGVPGRAAGYLDNPDGVDLAPPDSPAARRAGSAAETKAAGSWVRSVIRSRLCWPSGRFPCVHPGRRHTQTRLVHRAAAPADLEQEVVVQAVEERTPPMQDA
jgi:hypothetical protein